MSFAIFTANLPTLVPPYFWTSQGAESLFDIEVGSKKRFIEARGATLFFLNPHGLPQYRTATGPRSA